MKTFTAQPRLVSLLSLFVFLWTAAYAQITPLGDTYIKSPTPAATATVVLVTALATASKATVTILPRSSGSVMVGRVSGTAFAPCAC